METFDRADPGIVDTRYWHRLDHGRVQCDLCPRFCHLQEGQRGSCFVRACIDSSIKLTTWGRSSGFCIDPVEKKPLNHFYPGTSVLSFGTAGCNLFCRFCQNWDISKSRQMDTLMSRATPQRLVEAALQQGCRSIAYTYNDPVIFHEYAIDVAQQARAAGIRSIAVTAGYVCPEPRAEFYQWMDAANIDLKSFDDDFYWRLTGAHLAPVLETLRYVYHQTNVWLEITTLLIPGQNDSDAEIQQLSEWVGNELGPEVPVHFSAFHGDFKMRDIPNTPPQTLSRARQIARQVGLRYVYTGNVHDEEGDTTFCHCCGAPLIVRDWYEMRQWNLDEQGCCRHCHTPCAGHFDATAGHWGRKRQVLQL
jgi:pyruvate formate lyase activating enzyme